MPITRNRVILAVMVAAMTAATASAIPSAHAQDPPANAKPGAAKGQANAKPSKKKVARRKPRNSQAGVIVPFLMPPSLIIRQTPQAHDEIQALLNMLRYQ